VKTLFRYLPILRCHVPFLDSDFGQIRRDFMGCDRGKLMGCGLDFCFTQSNGFVRKIAGFGLFEMDFGHQGDRRDGGLVCDGQGPIGRWPAAEAFDCLVA